jgi:nucleoside-triphosphatase THEP1
MLAMSWNLFQKIFNLIIFYGSNMVNIYSNIMSYAAREMNLKFDTFWVPLFFLLALYALFGTAAAAVGIRTGRRLASMPPNTEQLPLQETNISAPGKSRKFRYSLIWLAADILLIAGLLYVVNNTTWFYWVITVIPVVIIFSLRYKRALRQLMKPRFWILFVLITMLSALAFTSLQPDRMDMAEGMMIGVQMNFRAVIIIIGFSALGTELYNPKMRRFISRTRFKQLPVALELSASALPMMIAEMPDLKSAFKDPASVIIRMISRVEGRMKEAKTSGYSRTYVYIVTGKVGGGKTAFLQRLTDALVKQGATVGGILAPRIIEGSLTAGYDILEVETGRRNIFLREKAAHAAEMVGRFQIYEEGYEAGLNALDPENNRDKTAVIIDEVGPLELNGRGWSSRIMQLLKTTGLHIIITVRRSLVGEVTEKFGIDNPAIFDVGNIDNDKVIQEISQEIMKSVTDA